jgi:glycosyltransferase involved in cell wall biosynthesis
MEASVVIPTHNRREILSRVIRYYQNQEETGCAFELVVVDDGSTDGTEQLFNFLKDVRIWQGNRVLERHRALILMVKSGFYRSEWGPGIEHKLVGKDQGIFVNYIKIKKSGRSIARNVGIGFSRFSLIIFADDDIFVEPEFIKKHCASHSPGDKVVVMGRVIHTQNLDDPFSARWKPRDINRAFLSTGNASVLKDYLVEAGLFNEGYSVYGWEDFDLGIHLKEMGLTSIRKKIYGYHYERPVRFLNPGPVYEKERERGRSAFYFYRSHPLRWVKRFTLVNSRVLRFTFRVLGLNNWFLSREKIAFLKRLLLLIIRYKGYFDGLDEARSGCSDL